MVYIVETIRHLTFNEVVEHINKKVCSIEMLSETLDRPILVNTPYQFIKARTFNILEDEVLRIKAGETLFTFSDDNFYVRKETSRLIVLVDKYSLHSVLIKIKEEVWWLKFMMQWQAKK